jgi:uncharacterized protein YuzE
MSVHIGPYTFDGVTYDSEADVLYLTIGEAVEPVDWDETPEGHGVSFDEDGNLVGLTIVDARRLSEEAGGELVVKLPARAKTEDLAHSFALTG